VLVYGPPGAGRALCSPNGEETDLLRGVPAYLRRSASYEMEGVSYFLDTLHGAPSFDSPGGACRAAAKLFVRLGIKKLLPCPAGPLPVLVHGEDQGHFPAWLVNWAEGENPGGAFPFCPLVLSGRNILALEAGRHNTLAALGNLSGERPEGAGAVILRPAVDLSAPAAGNPPLPEPPPGGYPLIAAFPGPVPQTGGPGSYWEGFGRLLAPGGIVLAGMSASEAERFDRKKPKNFTRLGDVKRKGFRALAYQRGIRLCSG
jgi:hypothetical protein